jgi:hypothetical protein
VWVERVLRIHRAVRTVILYSMMMMPTSVKSAESTYM